MHSGKPLKIVVLYSSGHLGSNIILNQILKMNCYEVLGIVKAQIVDFTPEGYQKVQKTYRKLGLQFSTLLLWQRIVQGLSFTLSKLLPENSKFLKTSRRISESIPCLSCQNINDQDSQTFIKQLQPDLLISAYFHQILKPSTLEIPTKGTLNIHPGWLPTFKGSMNYFRAMALGAPKAGTSVHWMDEGIDTGTLLARKEFTLKPHMTQETTMVKTAYIGASLLNRIGKKLQKGKEPKPVKIDSKEQSQYFKMPQEKDFSQYTKKHRFFRIRDIVGLIFWRPLSHQLQNIFK